MKLFIKNMVCPRCILSVEQLLTKHGIRYKKVELGEVELEAPISDHQTAALNADLKAIGFSFIDNRKGRMIEQIKNIIISLIRNGKVQPTKKLSDILSEALHYDYNYISNTFSGVEGSTIERYYIAQKIERVKELLVYDELSLSEIAYQLGYSSTAHLSSQFKKVTGLTPSHFKTVKEHKRRSLDEI